MSQPLIGSIDAQGGRVVVAEQIGTVNLEDRSFDVSGRPSPYLGLTSFTYATRDRYAGREPQVEVALRLALSSCLALARRDLP